MLLCRLLRVEPGSNSLPGRIMCATDHKSTTQVNATTSSSAGAAAAVYDTPLADRA